MKIGIVGAGHIGTALATHFVKLQHEVSIANSRGPDTLKDVAKKTGARAVTVKDALQKPDLVVVTIPLKNVPELPAGLFQSLPESTVIIDTCNYYPDSRDGLIPELEGKMAESAWVEMYLGRPVVKAFNNIMAFFLAEGGKPKGAPGRIALPVAGDDAEAKKSVITLINEMGFDGVDVGSIAESWRQQPGQPVYGTNLNYDGVRDAIAHADHPHMIAMRKRGEKLMGEIMAVKPPEEVVKQVRALHGGEKLRKAG